MRFFSTLPILALVAGAFAAPAVMAPTTDVAKRCDACDHRSVVDIIVDVEAKLKTPCGQLVAINADVDVVANVQIAVDVAVAVLVEATAEVKALAGLGAEVILGVEAGVLVKIEVVAKVLISLFTLVISACGSVLAVAGLNFIAVQAILVVLAKALVGLCIAIIDVCAVVELKVLLLAGIQVLLPICLQLNLFAFLNILGLKLAL